MFGLANNLIEEFEQAQLFRSHQFGVADDVDKEDISDLEFDFLAHFSWHGNDCSREPLTPLYQFSKVMASAFPTSFFRREVGNDFSLWRQACRLRMCRTAADTAASTVSARGRRRFS